MAYAFVAQNDAFTTASGTSQTLGVTYASGETVLGLSYDAQASGTRSLSDGTNGTYNKNGSEFQATPDSVYGASFYIHNVAAGAVTITNASSVSAANRSVMYCRYTGLSNVAPQDIKYAGPNSTTGADTVTTGNLTPTSQPLMLWGVALDSFAGASMAAGTAFNDRGALAARLAGFGDTSRIEDKRLTATTAVPATFTSGSAGARLWLAAMLLTEAGGGGASIVPILMYQYRQRKA